MGRKMKDGLFSIARREFEASLVDKAIGMKQGNKSEAARMLGVSYATLKTIVKSSKDSTAAKLTTTSDRELAEAIRGEVLARLGGTPAPIMLRDAIAQYKNAVRLEMIERVLKVL